MSEPTKIVQDWKAWHRQVAYVLDCKYLERNVTLERIREVMAELARLRTQLATAERALEEIARRMIHFSELDVVDENWRQRRAQDALDAIRKGAG